MWRNVVLCDPRAGWAASAFKHPAMGVLHYQQVSLSLAGWPVYRLTMLLTAPAVSK
ncbi:hypothetical protein ABIA45_004180 [Bradyrhizobium sp. USDA 336]